MNMPVKNELSELKLDTSLLDLSPSGSSKGNNLSYFVIFSVLVAAMNVRQKTVVVQAKEIELNAALQNKFNREEAKIKFYIPPEHAGTKTVAHYQLENQKAGIEKGNIENFLITAHQMGSTDMSGASESVDVVQQDASQAAGWLRTLNTIFKTINQISQKMA